ncbi:hypothetical protein [Photobacterium damselae]|uniref:Ribonucleotide-diphosphate reductase subunit alpha n=1 Tax=Photobacterium damselae TaxID=38293 RepID=A0A2X1ZLN9_PHODM|nr:hypothetical protein [Photobacterium damselae]SPY45265.1 ribonucleotide-diphosphate reductase subunit alpha [Photobacterium damselae]
MLYKDACNEKSNQKNLGTIKSSNLCAEIMEVSTPDETAACNLASLACLSSLQTLGLISTKLHQVTKVAIKNLDRVIDVNYHPTDKIEQIEPRTSSCRFGYSRFGGCVLQNASSV